MGSRYGLDGLGSSLLSINISFGSALVLVYIQPCQVGAPYFLHSIFAALFVLPILIELGKACSHIVHKELGQFFVAFHHKTEELAMVIIHHIS
jgi:hypothetical protein